MKFGDPIIYKCPSCKKKMKMMTYLSYTSRGRELYSDGVNASSPNVTPDFSKCPHCSAVFFRQNIKNPKKMNIRPASNIERIENPNRIDFINALEKRIAKNWKEEKRIREDLWHNFNNTYRYLHKKLSERLLKIYKENCKALLHLAEKSLAEMNKEDHVNNNYNNCIIMIAELNRNLGNFDECIKILNNLETEKSGTDSDWNWLTKKFIRECDEKNTVLFELWTDRELYLEDDTDDSLE